MLEFIEIKTGIALDIDSLVYNTKQLVNEADIALNDIMTEVKVKFTK